jgi:hypothetical protein
VVAVLAAASPAQASGGARVNLRWSAPEGCPDAAHVTGEVDRLLGEESPRPAAQLDVAATVTRDDGGELTVRLETQGDGGARVREIKGTSCAAVADAAALLVALIIDPVAASRAVPAPSPPVVPPPPVPSPPPPAPPPPALPPPVPVPPSPPGPASTLRPSLRLLGWTLADAGSLPGISAAFGGKAVMVIAPLRFELGGGVWFDRRTTVPQQPSAGGNVGLAAGSADACWSFLRPGPLELGPCLGFELGRLHADGFGGTTQGGGSVLWSALQGGALFAWAPVRWIAGVLRLDAAVPFARPTFVIDVPAPVYVYRSSPVVGRATLAVEVRFR